MHMNDFGERKSGRFTTTLQGNAAFIPDPLMALDLPITWQLASQLSAADAAVAEAVGACRRQLNPSLVIRPFQRNEAILSSRIEGTIATPQELAVMEADPAAGLRGSEDAKEVHNYLRALDLGIEQLATLPLSLRLIRNLHECLMKGVRGEEKTPGEFRRDQVSIGKKGQTEKEARFVPPPPLDMVSCLDDFERFLHTDRYPSLIRMAIMHYQFEAIHPFGDGNGRTGRLLMALFLQAEKRTESPIVYLSPFFERNDREYRDLLLSVSTHGTWIEWVSFVLGGIVSQCQEATRRIGELDVLATDFKARIRKAPGPLQAVVEDLFFSPIIHADMIAAKYGVSHQTAMNWIGRLQEAGILNGAQKSGRRTLYIAKELL